MCKWQSCSDFSDRSRSQEPHLPGSHELVTDTDGIVRMTARPYPFSAKHPIPCTFFLSPIYCTPATWSISRVETSTRSGRTPGIWRGERGLPSLAESFNLDGGHLACLQRNRVASRGVAKRVPGLFSALHAAFSAQHPKLDVDQHDSPEHVEMGLYPKCYAGWGMHARCAARLDPEACELLIAEKLDAREHGSPEMATGWK
jgi:hypothetical protein